MLIKDIINETTSSGGIATVAQPMTKKVIKRAGPVEKGKIKIGKGIYDEGKSPHKKGTKKYKKHMAAKHANMGEDYKESIRNKLQDCLLYTSDAADE